MVWYVVVRSSVVVIDDMRFPNEYAFVQGLVLGCCLSGLWQGRSMRACIVPRCRVYSVFLMSFLMMAACLTRCGGFVRLPRLIRDVVFSEVLDTFLYRVILSVGFFARSYAISGDCPSAMEGITVFRGMLCAYILNKRFFNYLKLFASTFLSRFSIRFIFITRACSKMIQVLS